MDTMLKTRRRFLATLVAGGAAAALPATGAEVGPGKPAFRIFNSMIYRALPNLQLLGMPRLLSTGTLWRASVPHSEVDPDGVTAAVRELVGKTSDFYFDLEEWPLQNVASQVIATNIDKLAQVASIARRAAPQLKFGFYDMAPRATYWPLVLQKAPELAEWHDLNRRSAVIAANCDYTFPSLYTFYNNLRDWQAAARGVLQEARRYGKPVYPFLWPQFHDSNAEYKGTYVPRDFWRQQLETVRDHADGFVLWGGYLQRWDENAPWWQEVQKIAVEMRVQPLA
jgi:hypothetical protein